MVGRCYNTASLEVETKLSAVRILSGEMSIGRKIRFLNSPG